jgi:hypothetical protein
MLQGQGGQSWSLDPQFEWQLSVLNKIEFLVCKKISFLALIGYIGGAASYIMLN